MFSFFLCFSTVSVPPMFWVIVLVQFAKVNDADCVIESEQGTQKRHWRLSIQSWIVLLILVCVNSNIFLWKMTAKKQQQTYLLNQWHVLMWKKWKNWQKTAQLVKRIVLIMMSTKIICALSRWTAAAVLGHTQKPFQQAVWYPKSIAVQWTFAFAFAFAQHTGQKKKRIRHPK